MQRCKISLDMIPYYFLPDIFKYLESDDQRQLRLVSREWNDFLLPFVFSRLSTDMYEGFEKLLRKYSNFVTELEIYKLDAGITDLLSACEKTTRLLIDLSAISPEAALQLGENFPLLSYLGLNCADSAKVRYLSPLTRKVQTLYYRPVACDDPDEFMNYYKDFDCPLVKHLIIHEEWALAGHNFPHIVKRFPALKAFDYTGPYLHGYQFDHFVYDVEKMVFKEISFGDRDVPVDAFLRFKDVTPSKTPLLSSHQEVTHESQFDALLSTYIDSSYSFIAQFTYLDAVDVKTEFVEQKDFIELLLSLKEIRSLSFDFKNHDFSSKLYTEIFKATTVCIELVDLKLPVILDWLTRCFPNLEELSIRLLDLPTNYDEAKKSESKLTFEFWEKLLENHHNLSKIHLSNGVLFQCQIEKNFPHILVDNTCKARYYEYL